MASHRPRRIAKRLKERDMKLSQSPPPSAFSTATLLPAPTVANVAYCTALATDAETLMKRLGFDDRFGPKRLHQLVAEPYRFELKVVFQLVRWHEIGLVRPHEIDLPHPALLMVDLRRRIAASPTTHVPALIMDGTIARMVAWWQQHTVTSSWRSVKAHVRVADEADDLADALADFLWDTRSMLAHSTAPTSVDGSAS
jgi:hypothetical protein